MYPLILPAVSKNIIDKGRKSICVTVSLRTYMYSQLIYLHFGGSYTSFTQLEAEIYALEYKCAYGIFTLSPDLSRFKSTNNKSQLYHTDIHVQVLIAFND